MAVYFITGKLGSGKTLCAVGRIKQYLETGRQVATNLDIHLDKMFDEQSKKTCIRLPDKPRLKDLEMLGSGCREEDESKYGLIVLDELGTWFNSRNWRDKERLALIDWCLHARKYHWDIFFIVQSVDSLDGQLVNALCEHLVVCKRTDRLSFPIVGGLLRFLGFEKTMPKVHVANVHYGQNESSPRVHRWVYRAKELYTAYNTAQVFTDEQVIIKDEIKDARASYSILSSYHLNAVAYRQILLDKIDKIKGVNHRTRLTSGGGVLSQKFNTAYLTFFVLFSLAFYGFYRNYYKEPSLQASELTKQDVQLVKSKQLISSVKVKTIDYNQPSQASITFVDRLLSVYKPRLSAYVYSSKTKQMYALIEFYQGNQIVERLDIDSLHALGIGVVIKPYGVDLITADNAYPVTSWVVSKSVKPKKSKSSSVVF